MIRAEAYAPDITLFFDDTAEHRAPLGTYCAEPTCSPSSLCATCVCDGRLCECCPPGVDRPAVAVVQADSWPLVVCGSCAAMDLAESRPGLVAFVGGLVGRAS